MALIRPSSEKRIVTVAELTPPRGIPDKNCEWNQAPDPASGRDKMKSIPRNLEETARAAMAGPSQTSH